MKRLIFLSSLAILLLVAAVSIAQESSWKISPLFDLRVRQEVLDGVLYFSPDPDRQWVRFRTRGGLKTESAHHDFTLRLVNEHRRFLVPEPADFDWDELIFDQAKWDWKPSATTTLTFGRQNIIWDDGFLVLEGHPLDGSRSIYQDGLRLRTTWSGHKLDLFAVHNNKRDPYVLAGDENRQLTDGDETGVGAKISLGQHRLAAIWKKEEDPDQILLSVNTVTLDGRFTFGDKAGTSGFCELALQYYDGLFERGNDWPSAGGFDVAFEAQLKGDFLGPVTGDLGFFYYGDNFRTPWGRWPKWSELYIYSLLGEGGDGRVHVAAWENIAAPRMNLHYQINDMIRARWGLTYLLAPKSGWQGRGLLMQTELKFDLAKGFDGHLLWEMLEPGSFHDHPGGMTQAVHFLRWQFAYTFK